MAKINGPDEPLLESIRRELEMIMETLPPPVRFIDSGVQSQLRVLEDIKRLNPKAYKPTLISIGPIYHGLPEFQEMQVFKIRYAIDFIEMSRVCVGQFIEEIAKSEDLLREEYAIDSSKISSEEFRKIMLIDSAFIIEFLMRLKRKRYHEMELMSQRKWKNILSDMLLLENQIPFHLLRKLLNDEDFEISMKELLNDFLSEALPYYYDKMDFRHYNHLGYHLLDTVWIFMQPRNPRRNISRTISLPSCPTILELHRAGVKFRRNNINSYSSRSNFDIRFRRGVLEIPQLNIDDSNASFFANLMALEASKGQDRYVTDYVAMMDYLIDRPEDVQLLVLNGIIENFIKDEEATSCLINELGKNIDVRPDFYYSDIVEDLNAYCKRRWIKWKSTFVYEWKMDLKRNYFSNPWKALSVIAAIILLGLTIIQTVCSILQLK